MYSFMTYMGMDEDKAREAVQIYRERYTTVGLYENRVFPGIRRLLRTLRRAGWYIGIATGKPQETSEQVIAHFGLDKFFDRIVGPDGGTAHPDKEQLIRQALPESYDEAWMVGDRRFDVEGGLAAGIHTMGVG